MRQEHELGAVGVTNLREQATRTCFTSRTASGLGQHPSGAGLHLNRLALCASVSPRPVTGTSRGGLWLILIGLLALAGEVRT